ncbi:MAG: amidohydrolase family protein [Saprospiraceae bacterium]
MNIQRSFAVLSALLLLLGCSPEKTEIPSSANPVKQHNIRAFNRDEISAGDKTIAITGATLIDGNGGETLPDAVVLIENDRIKWVGKADEYSAPAGVEVMDATGLFLLPGLMDAHYHLNDPNDFLLRGVTSIRDPGAWNESYDPVRAKGQPLPRLFLTGPHLDMYPPAYPNNSFLVRDAAEARVAVNKFADQGATAIKVYFRLSLGIIQAICETAHARDIPVVAHLEITHAGDAIEAGLDGIEHITSFGTALLPMQQAEKYKQLILADNAARDRGRYEVWNSLDLENNPQVDTLLKAILKHKTVISPTLAVFERQYDQGDSIEVNGFQNMLTFLGMAHRAGARIVVGSHTWAPYGEGFAYAREMELLVKAGMSNAEVIVAATMENARYFQVEDRLGSIEAGKQADLILLKENPLEDIRAIRSIERVMLNGVWISVPER